MWFLAAIFGRLKGSQEFVTRYLLIMHIRRREKILKSRVFFLLSFNSFYRALHRPSFFYPLAKFLHHFLLNT
jgi:hypothetical protein